MDCGDWAWDLVWNVQNAVPFQLLMGYAVPILGILAGAVLAHVKKDRGWYLLSLVFGARLLMSLIWLAAAFCMGFAIGFAGLLPVPN